MSNESFDILNRSMGGLMVVTAFLSMWINNSAAANIMIPAAIGLVNELQNYHNATKRIARSDSTGTALTQFRSCDAYAFEHHISNRNCFIYRCGRYQDMFKRTTSRRTIRTQQYRHYFECVDD
jgi:hypothetical protein